MWLFRPSDDCRDHVFWPTVRPVVTDRFHRRELQSVSCTSIHDVFIRAVLNNLPELLFKFTNLLISDVVSNLGFELQNYWDIIEAFINFKLDSKCGSRGSGGNYHSSCSIQFKHQGNRRRSSWRSRSTNSSSGGAPIPSPTAPCPAQSTAGRFIRQVSHLSNSHHTFKSADHSFSVGSKMDKPHQTAPFKGWRPTHPMIFNLQ